MKNIKEEIINLFTDYNKLYKPELLESVKILEY
jgi:hypothetical protein